MRVPKKDLMFVSTQFILFALYLFDFLLRFSIPYWLIMTGVFVALIGVTVLIFSLLQLNKNVSPFPTPKSDSELRTTGLYAFIRHPIYTGILLIAFGYSVYQTSSWKLVVAVCLLILFYFKSEYEERLLIKRFKEYKNYQKRTGRFFMKIK